MEVGYEHFMSILVVNIVVLRVVRVVGLWCFAQLILPFEKCATLSKLFMGRRQLYCPVECGLDFR
jgi:hypothetical protein